MKIINAKKLALALGCMALAGCAGLAGPKGEPYEVIVADGQVIRVGEGETYQNKLIDVSGGGNFRILIDGGNSVVRNIGFMGLYQGGGFPIQVYAPEGNVLVENIYAGDGANKDGGSHPHGPGFMFYQRTSAADVTVRYVHVQGWPNNGFYMSNTSRRGGSVVFENCYGKNNGVSTFRTATENDRIINCVAYNDHTDYSTDYAVWGLEPDWRNNDFYRRHHSRREPGTPYIEQRGRPVWVWGPGGTVIENSHFANGPYGMTVVSHQGGRIDFRSGAFAGPLGGTEEAITVHPGVGREPDLSMPAGVPRTAEEAAAGLSGRGSY